MSCKKALGIAEELKKKFGEKIRLEIYTTDSKEAEKYNFRSSTNVLCDGELIPLDIALDVEELEDFLSDKLSA